MKFNCFKCGEFIVDLDLRKEENKDEFPAYCRRCLEENIGFTRGLFEK